MPGFETSVSHSRTREDVKQRLNGFLDVVRNKYKDMVKDVNESWEGDTLNYSFKTYGFNISGAIAVDDDKVHLKCKLPIAAMAFRGKIEQTMKSDLEKIVG